MPYFNLDNSQSHIAICQGLDCGPKTYVHVLIPATSYLEKRVFADAILLSSQDETILNYLAWP